MDSSNSVQTILCEKEDKKSEFHSSDDERYEEGKLFSAIHKRKLQKVKAILDKGVKTNIIDRNNKNNTPLHCAVGRGVIDIVRELLCEKWSTNVSAKNAVGDTPLHIAASKGYEELVQLLISKQAKINVENNEGQTPLDVASDPKTIQVFERYRKSLLREEYFVKVTVPADGSCLFWATALAYLLPVRCNGNLFCKRFEILFGSVSSAELIKQIQQLFQRYSPYVYNTDIFRDETLKCLVTKVFRSRIIKEMSLQQNSFEDCVTVADIFYTRNESYVVTGAFQKQFCKKFSTEINTNGINVEVLKPNVFDETTVRAIDNELDKLPDQGKLKQFRLETYLECMRDPNAWGGDQEIQVMSQMLQCNIYVFKNFTQHLFTSDNSCNNILLFNDDSHYTLGVIKAQVLIESMKGNKMQDAKTYCAFGIDDANYSDCDNYTALHLAAKQGSLHIVELLLNQGANKNAKNSSIQTPLDVAKSFENDCVIRLLSEHSQEVQSEYKSVHQSLMQKQSDSRELNFNCKTNKVNCKILHDFDQTPLEVDSSKTDKERSNFKDFQLGVDNSGISNGQSCPATTLGADEQVYNKGGTAGIKGGIYQVKLLMLFLYRALEKRYSFRLATEMESAEKFDDLVFEYISGNQKVYRFLQAKHREDESKKISVDDLLTLEPSDFSLLKYFSSYCRIKQNPEYQNNIIKDFIICTNIDFKFGSSGKLKLECVLQKVQGRDNILHIKCKGKDPVCYRFKNTFLGEEKVFQILREASDLTRLAKQLAQCVLYDKPIQHHLEDSIFKHYHVALAKEVIDAKNKTFQTKFLNAGSEESHGPLRIFRSAFEKEIKIEIQQYLQLKDAKKKVKKIGFVPNCEQNLLEQIKEKKIKLHLSKGFGEGTGEETSLPSDEISESKMKCFLKHLVFAVNQPNEVELGEIIKNELGSEFNNIDKKNIYSRFLEEILDWMKEKEGRFLSPKEGKAFFDKVKQEILGTIWFNVKAPVTLFTGREKELEELHNAVQRSHKGTVISQITSISGLGGIGKTELARRYVHDHCEDYDGNVIWINAEKYETLVESFLDLAVDSRLSIPTSTRGGKEKKIESIVKEIYRFFATRKSIFVFDNAEKSDDLNLFLPLRFLKFTDNKPYILITSREKEWENGIEVIELKELKLEDSIDFVKKVLNIENVDKLQQVKDLVMRLQCFPLAMQQSVAYIGHQQAMGKYDISDYLKELDKKAEYLLSSVVFRGIDNDYTKTTFTTWNITVDKIGNTKECGQLALVILSAIAYIAPNNIDRDMFFNIINGTDEQELKKVRQAVNLLVKYSMLSSAQQQSVLSVHRLVQDVMRLEFSAQRTEKEVLRGVLYLINTNIEKYLDHAVCAWQHATKYNNLIKEFSPLSSLITYELEKRVRYDEAYLFAREAAKLLKKVLGPDYPCTVRINHNLAEILDYQGHYSEAFSIFQDVLARSKKIFGDDHRETLSTLHDLAVVLFEMGRYKESVKCYLEVLEKEKKNMRHNEPEVLTTMQGLAAVYSALGEYNEALKIYEDVLSKTTQILGPDHHDTLMARNNRASVLCSLKNYNEALKELHEILNKRKCIVGVNHPDTLYTMHDIGRVLLGQKKYGEALKIFQEVCDKTEEVLNSNHPDMLTPMDSVAAALVNLHNYDEAIKAYDKVLNKKIKILGPDHPDTISTMRDRAKVLYRLGDFEKLLAAYQEILKIQVKNLGSSHKNTLVTTIITTYLVFFLKMKP